MTGLLDHQPMRRLGVPAARAAVSVPSSPPGQPPSGNRVMHLAGTPLLELPFWCGTCDPLIRRLAPVERDQLIAANDRLTCGLSSIDADAVSAYAKVLPESDYVILLVEIGPRLVESGAGDDYFTVDLLRTWDPPVLGVAEEPGEPVGTYYRTFETPVDRRGHLYELVIPMVPPSMNEATQVQQYVDRSDLGTTTVVAYSLLDVVAPAIVEGEDYHQHWLLSHFLLDGHHRIEAAARAGRSIRLLAFVDVGASLATADEVATMTRCRAAAPQIRVQGMGQA